MRTWLFACGVVLVGCDSDSGNIAMPDATGGGSADASSGCTRLPGMLGAADRDRFAVVAHPYDTDGNSTPNFEVVRLSASGELSRFSPVRMFQLGNRMPFGTIAFTPDGAIGIAPLDNGKLGVFSLDGEGVATVVDPGFSGSFYAQQVVMDPSGERAWVVDRNTRNNGGGIYEIGIGCDGALTDRGQVVAARSPGGLAFAGTRAVVPARDIASSPTTVSDVHILDFAATPPAYVGGGDAFGDDDQVFGGFALSHDGLTAFIGDANFTGTNRVAVASVGASTVTSLKVISMITDPSAIIASPFGDVAVVTSSQPPGEGIYVLDKNGTGGSWRNRGELTYVGGAAQLPGDMVLLDRGSLAGHVLVSELSGIRQIVIDPSGGVSDLGSLVFGDGLEEIGGAIGLQP